MLTDFEKIQVFEQIHNLTEFWVIWLLFKQNLKKIFSLVQIFSNKIGLIYSYLKAIFYFLV